MSLAARTDRGSVSRPATPRSRGRFATWIGSGRKLAKGGKVPQDPHNEVAIRTEGLTKFYGAQRGIAELDLAVMRGEVYGFLGPNAAGKTTTIRCLLDLIHPTRGRASIFGLDSHDCAVAIHARVGYVPGEFSLYGRLTGGQNIEYFANLRGGVPAASIGELTDRLHVDLRQRYTSYSKGDKQKIALIIALAHQPDLLILDEPTSGLDPIVQQEFYALVGEARAAGRTAFLSSHVLSEVERVCDRAAIIRDGAIAAVEEIGALRDALHHQVEIRFAGPVPVERFASLAGVSDVSSGGDVLTMRVTGPIGPVVSRAAEFGVVDFISREPSLEEIFLARYRAAEPEPAGGAK